MDPALAGSFRVFTNGHILDSAKRGICSAATCEDLFFLRRTVTNPDPHPPELQGRNIRRNPGGVRLKKG